MITRTAEYALRALLVLAREGPGRPVPSERIATATGMPANYTSKTLHRLAQAGLVSSTRGPAGGFTLARTADAISVADVAAIFAERPRTDRCLLGNRVCDPAIPCAAHDRWTMVKNSIQAALATTSLSDLIANTTSDFRGSRESFASGLAGAF
ncbi:MAG TPA: Rrf2 family transcriptional regulator [Gemmatimonadaceae bacterium]|nr:Rrf2 family transcriptional regulator [Gemmatimonadaceae bacterium]